MLTNYLITQYFSGLINSISVIKNVIMSPNYITNFDISTVTKQTDCTVTLLMLHYYLSTLTNYLSQIVWFIMHRVKIHLLFLVE